MRLIFFNFIQPIDDAGVVQIKDKRTHILCKSSFCINAKNNQGLLNKIDFYKVIIFYLNKNKNIKLNVQPFCTFEDEHVNIT